MTWIGRLCPLHRTFNQRFQRYPAAIVYAKNTDDVAGAVACGYQYGVPVSAAGGRHSYQSQSLLNGYLVIDMSNFTEVCVTA